VTTVRRWRDQKTFQRTVERISAFFEKNQLDRYSGRFGSGGVIVAGYLLSSGPNRPPRMAELILPSFDKLTPKIVDRIVWHVSLQI
jgi:hypothetical protein